VLSLELKMLLGGPFLKAGNSLDFPMRRRYLAEEPRSVWIGLEFDAGSFKAQ